MFLDADVRLYKRKYNTKPTSYLQMRRGDVMGPSRSNYGVSEVTCYKTREESPSIYSRAPFILYRPVGAETGEVIKHHCSFLKAASLY